MRIVLLTLGMICGLLTATQTQAASPYPRSTTITGITWDMATYRHAGGGGDIWPTTWAQDGSVRTAWGDGVLGCGTKVTYGVASIPGGPGASLNTVGCGPAGMGKGKILSLIAVGSRLYALSSLQNRPYPLADYAIWSSDNGGRTWTKASWAFSGTEGSIRPTSFVNVGKANAGAGYVYLLATRAGSDARATQMYLLRVAAGSVARGRSAYSYFSGTSSSPAWSASVGNARAVFADPAGVRRPELVRVAGLGRYLLTAAHTLPGRLGVFEARQPWGPWRTVSYVDGWLGMANSGASHYLGVRFPVKWIADGGRTLWAVFSCHNNGTANACGKYHDRYNLMRARLTVAGR